MTSENKTQGQSSLIKTGISVSIGSLVLLTLSLLFNFQVLLCISLVISVVAIVITAIAALTEYFLGKYLPGSNPE